MKAIGRSPREAIGQSSIYDTLRLGGSRRLEAWGYKNEAVAKQAQIIVRI